ncbi:hypothetical protein H106_06565 [Trichophyton rubrum CBS 735.88]|nr:hypothetical protein H106_06565 [Trichophyton rubrum CBS 735.88]
MASTKFQQTYQSDETRYTRKFSASTVPKEALLTLRPIWPEKKGPEYAVAYITELDYFFNEDHINDAIKLMGRNLLGLDMLGTLFQLICDPEDTPISTPPKYSGTLAGGLGPFSMLTSLFNQLEDRSIQASIEERRVFGAPRTSRFYDAMQHAARDDPESPTYQNFEELDMVDIEMADSDDRPIPDSPPAMFSTTAEGVEEPPRRTPTETLVADFIVTLLGGLASLVQGLSPRPLCMANSFETTYQFGPPSHPTSLQHGGMQFRARVDGSIPFSLSVAGMPREAAIFEVKRAPRKGRGSGIPVLAQQAMEHAAYIWKCHASDSTWKNTHRTYHTFMVAQDHLGFHISIGTYDTSYLEYIFGPGSQPVLPTRGTNKFPFLQIQELGPFNVKIEGHLRIFLRIMLAFILWQLEKASEDAVFKEVL